MVSIDRLQSIDPPYKFERLISDIWVAKGYSTNIRKKSGDRGIDIEAEKGGYKQVIQAKRYSSGNKVGSQDVRKYATLYQQVPTANAVVIATSSRFTDEARRLAGDLNVEMYNGARIINEMQKFDICINQNESHHTANSDSNSNVDSLSDENPAVPRVETPEIHVKVLSILQNEQIADVGSSHSVAELTEMLETGGDLSGRVGLILSVKCIKSQIEFNTHEITFISGDGYEYDNTSGIFTGYFESGLDSRFSSFSDTLSHKQTKKYFTVSDTIPEGVIITGISYNGDPSFKLDFTDERDLLIQAKPGQVL